MQETHTSVKEKRRLTIGDDRKLAATRTFQWIFYLATSFYFGAVFLRSVLIYQNSSELLGILTRLLLWLALFISEPRITRRWQSYFSVYLVIQTLLVFLLLNTPADFFAALLVILRMQLMRHLDTKIGVAWILLCALGMPLSFVKVYKSQTIELVLLNMVGLIFYNVYSRAIRRAQNAHPRNQALAQELEEANQKLQAYTSQLKQRVMVQERNRLACELDDTVSQLIFRINPAVHSAQLLIKKDPARVPNQLRYLPKMISSALNQLRSLITELRPR